MVYYLLISIVVFCVLVYGIDHFEFSVKFVIYQGVHIWSK